MTNKQVKAAYIHIPFCDSICSYCDFCKMFYNRQLVDDYLINLSKEINDDYCGEEMESIYIGGGTPSCLSVVQLEYLFKILEKLKRNKHTEYTIEANWENLTNEKIDLCKKYGINRISIGIETTNYKLAKLLNRDFKEVEIRKTIKYLKDVGLDNINIDLIYAIPGETVEMLDDDLNFILSLDVPHISAYSLMVEEHTVLYIKKTAPIDEDEDFMFYQRIEQVLENSLYTHYEISNYGREGFYSRHNLTYWNNDLYYGFGAGASGYINDVRYDNTRSVTKYLNKKTKSNIEIVSKNKKMEYEVILALRKSEGLSKIKFKEKYGVNIEEVYNISGLINQKKLVEENGFVFIPKDKWYVSNEVLLEFIKE